MDDFDAELRLKRRRSLVFWSFVFSSALFGIADLFLYYFPVWTALSWFMDAIVGIILIYYWCRYDASIRNELISTEMKIGIILITIIAVPIYLKRTRGWKGAAKIGFGIPVMLLNMLLYYAGWYVSSWIASATGYYQ